MKFARINPRDIPAILDLIQTAFSHAWTTTGRQLNRAYLAKNIRQARKKDILIKIIDSKKIIGFGWAGKQKDFFGNPYGEIKLLIIHPDYQQKGLGTKLLDYLIKRLKTTDTRLTVLENNPAQKMYVEKRFQIFCLILRKNG